MKHILIIVVLFNLQAKAQDFRNVKWKMSIDTVRAREAAEPYKDLDNDVRLGYKVEIDGYDFTLIYYFDKDKLHSATLTYEEAHSSHETYYESFTALKELNLSL